MSETYPVVVGAGSLRSSEPGATTVPHRWTSQGVTVEAPFTGAHLLHTAVAGCVLNDLYREADRLGVVLQGVRVAARGGFDGAWESTGITYAVDLDTTSAATDVERLLAVVDDVAEIPRAVRAGAAVTRVTTSS
ncbi:OsmC family protein [Cellulomonas dongxiuzhuiae]|uniref:OsmC family protein n=1 Tax=Cellulomonas dongxiuzhuiae TaxID=2819979 RepID=A0ABX8GLU8_9CELL|nr:OsmC family protein [Cellulomonas dongxiuzhuiae]MBO3096405.1 OsmC family protein [Cellulomonas dongxiuzhuiae]QWC16813.1 OsmC family protein [Cellulomonas dongxiuzhuiae]